MKTFEKKLEEVCYGKKVADMNCSRDITIFYLIINRHLGDAITILNKVQIIKDYYGVKANRYHFLEGEIQKDVFRKIKTIKKIYIVTTKAIEGIAKLYEKHIDGIIVLNKQDLNCLEMYASSACSTHENIICDANVERRISEHFHTAEGAWTKWEMFGISELMWNLCLPRQILSQKLLSMEISRDTEQATDALIKEKQLDINNTIVLCPVAQSSTMLDLEVWEDFATFLQANKFHVFTNAPGNEAPICNTEKLDVSIDIIVCLAKKGVQIIGVQSGLMDVITRINPEKVVIVSVLKTDNDRQYAINKGSHSGINKVGKITYLRLANFDRNYVFKSLCSLVH